jgi:hypothetical protein
VRAAQRVVGAAVLAQLALREGPPSRAGRQRSEGQGEEPQQAAAPQRKTPSRLARGVSAAKGVR